MIRQNRRDLQRAGLALLLLPLILLGGCSAISTSFKEPKNEQTQLLVGAVTVDLFEYRGKTRTYRDGIDVIIAAKIRKSGGVVYKNYWVKTDERGYFMLANLPEGEYAFRGFRIQTFGAPFALTAVNPLEGPNDPYVIHNRGGIPNKGSHFDADRQDRVHNLKHHYFIIDRGESVHHTTLFRLDEVKTASGSLLMEPDVLTYFKQKQPDSMWFKPNTAVQ